MNAPDMRSNFVGTLPQVERRDFSSIGYDEALRRARDIVPVLRDRAQKCEDARMLIRENEQLLHETGLFRFHQPKAFGGMELDFVAIFDIPAEIARGCPSTAWNVGNLATHHWMLGYWDPETQHEVWDANPDALIASSIALAAGRARKTDDGYIVSGRWPFSSGVDNSDWNMLAVTVYDGEKAVDWRLCLVPKTDYEIIDTWYAMGMAGTGSKDIAVKELFVPERRALALARTRGGYEHPGAAINRSALFGIPILGAAGIPLSPASIGAAEGAYEHFLASMGKRTGTYTGAKVADFQAVQIKVARARALIDSGRALSRNASIALQEMSARGEVPDLATKLRFRAQSAFAVNQAREAVETLWSCYGAQGIYTRDPLQRYLRDVTAMNQHFSFNFDIAGAAFGLHALGGPYANPTM
ncbi:MAG: 3-hydroxy-9,10-secoandrosta,3,5(10)-triene-9,17-dione monooxygenase [Hyphomicrobiales bacterium]|nr:3-hydroxy-9,10-secoandrosta,3,5(10)-triene-9,17-dione monooxygenase [Hyphomicrobiales bacterium]